MLFADNTYGMIHVHIHLQCHSQIKTLWLPLLIYSIPLLYVSTPTSFLLTYLEIPLLVIMVQISIHSRP